MSMFQYDQLILWLTNVDVTLYDIGSHTGESIKYKSKLNLQEHLVFTWYLPNYLFRLITIDG